jgi:hypothetical protein
VTFADKECNPSLTAIGNSGDGAQPWNGDVGFSTTFMQSVPITTKVVSSNPVHGEVYSIQHYVIKFVSDLRQVGGFLQFPPPIKLTTTI